MSNYIREFAREYCSDIGYAAPVMRVLHRKSPRQAVRITEANRDDVRRLLRLGLTNTEITRRTGLSLTSVSRIKMEMRS